MFIEGNDTHAAYAPPKFDVASVDPQEEQKVEGRMWQSKKAAQVQALRPCGLTKWLPATAAKMIPHLLSCQGACAQDSVLPPTHSYTYTHTQDISEYQLEKNAPSLPVSNQRHA